MTQSRLSSIVSEAGCRSEYSTTTNNSMRTTLFAALAFEMLVQITSVAVTNYDAGTFPGQADADGIAIIDNTGAVLPVGPTSMSIAFGNFDTNDFNSASGAAVHVAFNQNGSGEGGASLVIGGGFSVNRANAATSFGQQRFLHWAQHLYRHRKRGDVCWIHALYRL